MARHVDTDHVSISFGFRGTEKEAEGELRRLHLIITEIQGDILPSPDNSPSKPAVVSTDKPNTYIWNWIGDMRAISEFLQKIAEPV